jgi:hypothetical protein
MRYSEAKTEFGIQLYRWAKTAQQKEIQEWFPSFRFCKEGPQKTCHFFKSLGQQEQLDFAQGLLQIRHEEAAKALGEVMSAATQEVMRRYRNARLIHIPGFGVVGDLKFAKHRALKKAVKRHFLTAFGDQCLPPDPLDRKNEVQFRMKCRGWVIKTSFEFGRWYPEITHEHNVWTGKWITKDQPEVLDANCLGFRLSYGDEIGFGSGWEYLTDEDIEPTCVAVIEHCRHMFDVLPELLKGLDLELLTV